MLYYLQTYSKLRLVMNDSVREISILLVTARDNSAVSAADIADHMPMGLGHISSYIKKTQNIKFQLLMFLMKTWILSI